MHRNEHFEKRLKSRRAEHTVNFQSERVSAANPNFIKTAHFFSSLKNGPGRERPNKKQPYLLTIQEPLTQGFSGKIGPDVGQVNFNNVTRSLKTLLLMISNPGLDWEYREP